MHRRHIVLHALIVGAALGLLLAGFAAGVLDFFRPWWLLGLPTLPVEGAFHVPSSAWRP